MVSSAETKIRFQRRTLVSYFAPVLVLALIAAPVLGQSWSFSLVGDSRSGTQGFKAALNQIHDAKDISGKELSLPEFIVAAGDFDPDDQNYSIYRSIFSGTPHPRFLPVIGNHDAGFRKFICESIMPKEGIQAQFAKSTVSYYADVRNVRMIIVDQYEGTGYRRGCINDAGIRWMEEAITSAREMDHIFVAMHVLSIDSGHWQLQKIGEVDITTEVRVGYSYRPVAEVSTWDLQTKTALLDIRHLCGDQHLTEALKTELRAFLVPLDLMLEAQLKLECKNGGPASSLYSVEPNLKEGRGSLRDLHRGRWIYRLLLGVDDQLLFSTLEKGGYLPAAQIAQVQAASEWFWRARNWLHLTAGKKSDILINNFQDRIARELDGIAAQEWLSRHFEHAESLAHFCESAMRALLEGPLHLDGARLQDGYLWLRMRDGSRGEGGAARLFHLSQKYSIPVSLQDRKALAQSKIDAERVPEPSEAEAWAFVSILNEGRETAATLRSLVRLGLMDRFVGGFSEMMRFVPRDPAHCCTVGEHSLRIIEHLEALRSGAAHGVPRFCELVSQCSHFDMLCLAALLHDSGKMLPGSDHSEAALELTRVVARRLGLAPEKREILETLVRHHLLLVRTARLQDLKSPGVIQNVAEKVRGADALRHLYVFTYVDTRAVAEKNWTSMDFRDLEELYKKVLASLSSLGAEGGEALTVEDKIGLIRRKLSAASGPDSGYAVQRHCDAMPAPYILNTPQDEIALHIQLLNRLESEKVVIDIYNRPGDDYSELTVCTYDDPHPGLLAKIAGVLYGCNVDIHKAQVFTLEKEQPVVLDTLWVRSGAMQISESRARRLLATLKQVLSGERSVEQFLEAVGRQPPDSIPLDSINLRNDLSEEHTIVHIVARDLRGLLYLMARVLSRRGLHIHSAKVATWNARAENNFYVTTVAGEQIAEEDLPRWKEQLTSMFQGITR